MNDFDDDNDAPNGPELPTPPEPGARSTPANGTEGADGAEPVREAEATDGTEQGHERDETDDGGAVPSSPPSASEPAVPRPADGAVMAGSESFDDSAARAGSRTRAGWCAWARRRKCRAAAVVSATMLVTSLIGAVAVIPEIRRQLGDGRDGGRIAFENAEMRDASELARSTARGVVRSNRSLPSYVVSLYNEGRSTATVERVEATVVAYARLGYCNVMGGGGDGEIEVSAEARIKLPTLPPPRESYQARLGSLGFKLAPDGADGIGVFFEMPEEPGRPDVYGLQLDLVDTATRHRRSIGRVIAAIPPSNPGVHLPGERETMRQAAKQDAAFDWCYRRNVEVLGAVLDATPDPSVAPAVRRTLISRLDREWHPKRTRDGARKEARALLSRSASGGPADDPNRIALAPIAAEATGDREFAQETRRRAIALLLGRARTAARGGAMQSPDAAAVLDLDPGNTEARRLYRRPRGTD